MKSKLNRYPTETNPNAVGSVWSTSTSVHLDHRFELVIARSTKKRSTPWKNHLNGGIATAIKDLTGLDASDRRHTSLISLSLSLYNWTRNPLPVRHHQMRLKCFCGVFIGRRKPWVIENQSRPSDSLSGIEKHSTVFPWPFPSLLVHHEKSQCFLYVLYVTQSHICPMIGLYMGPMRTHSAPYLR